MNSQWLTAVVSLVIGAVLQHFLANVAESKKARLMLLSQAYADFFRAIAALAPREPSSDESRRLARTSLADARARIAIYGSGATLRALAAQTLEPDLASERGQRTFIALCLQIRRDAGRASDGLDDELALALLGRPIGKEARG